jgi:hypothetical protein
LQLDVFTLVPHAVRWLTEQRPVAAVLGGELDLRLFSYRDTTPLSSGKSTTSPTAAAPDGAARRRRRGRRSRRSTGIAGPPRRSR